MSELRVKSFQDKFIFKLVPRKYVDVLLRVTIALLLFQILHKGLHLLRIATPDIF